MRSAGIEGISRRRRAWTTKRDRDARPAPDLVDRDFAVQGRDQLWVADITYIPTWAGFLYLAVVVDAWSRRVVGWAMANHLRTELVLDALNMALGQRQAAGVIHHSDQGCQLRFKGSSQHLTIGELRWRRASVDGQTVRYVHRCVHLAVRRLAGGRIADGSGRVFPAGCRAKKREWRPTCLRLSDPDGFAKVGAWHRLLLAPYRGATYRLSSEKKSLSFMPAGAEDVRSRASSVDPRLRFHANCAAMLRPEVGTWTIEQRRPSGTPISVRVARRLRYLLRTIS